MAEEPQVMSAAQVISRTMYDVDFRLQDARIYGQTPKTVGQTVVSNHTAQAQTSTMNFRYVDQKRMIWQSSVSSTSPVKATITSAVPFINSEGAVVIGSDQSGVPYPWGETYEAATQESTVNYTVVVGPNSTVTVSLLVTEGTFDVPFSYTQRDLLSDGTNVVTRMDDGIFTGVNDYNLRLEQRVMTADEIKLAKEEEEKKGMKTIIIAGAQEEKTTDDGIGQE